MRFLVPLLLAVLATPASAQRELPPLSSAEAGFLKQMSASMGRQLVRAHGRSGDKTFAKPKVRFDPARRQIVVTNRLNRSPTSAGRRLIKSSLRDNRASMCAVLASDRLRRTGVAIVLRAEMRSGSVIARETASASTCN